MQSNRKGSEEGILVRYKRRRLFAAYRAFPSPLYAACRIYWTFIEHWTICKISATSTSAVTVVAPFLVFHGADRHLSRRMGEGLKREIQDQTQVRLWNVRMKG